MTIRRKVILLQRSEYVSGEPLLLRSAPERAIIMRNGSCRRSRVALRRAGGRVLDEAILP
jgi:hypothetical protein